MMIQNTKRSDFFWFKYLRNDFDGFNFYTRSKEDNLVELIKRVKL